LVLAGNSATNAYSSNFFQNAGSNATAANNSNFFGENVVIVQQLQIIQISLVEKLVI
jgi:hypothetical protein